MFVSKQERVVNLILIGCNIYLRNTREWIWIMAIFKIEQKRLPLREQWILNYVNFLACILLASDWFKNNQLLSKLTHAQYRDTVRLTLPLWLKSALLMFALGILVIIGLIINDAKTDFLIIGTRQQLEKTCIESFIIGDTLIKPLQSVRNLGSWFHANMQMNVHIAKICSKAFRRLYNIRQIRKFQASG